MDIKIYGLIEPITNEIKYIGKTKQELSKRLYAHIHESKNSNTKKNKWIKSLTNKNLKPKIEEIDIVSESNWEFWEQYWISQFKAWGFELKNTDEGGKGQSSEFMKKNNPMFKKENREKISKSLQGNTFAKGFKHTEETKNKVKKNHARFWSNKKRSQRTIDKISETKSKPIFQFELNGDFIKKFNSVKEAILETKSDRATLYRCLNKQTKKCKGFIWSWNQDYLFDAVK
jgi:hypothetical protein